MTGESPYSLTSGTAEPTFLNLPKEKQDRLVSAALAEFGRQEYVYANLDRIADAANVAKGSLYQYFKNKSELHRYVVTVALERAWALFQEYLDREEPKDCFEMFACALIFAAELKKREPEIALIYSRVGFPRHGVRSDTAVAQILRLNQEFQGRFFDWGTRSGLIAADIDREVAGFVLDALGSRFHERVFIEDPQYGLSSGDRERVASFAQEIVEFLRQAFRPNAPSPERRTP